jgi:hypothetical protein
MTRLVTFLQYQELFLVFLISYLNEHFGATAV